MAPTVSFTGREHIGNDDLIKATHWMLGEDARAVAGHGVIGSDPRRMLEPNSASGYALRYLQERVR